jgi:hypothetical protein
MVISAPQKQRDRPSAVCVGNSAGAAHIACFHASLARRRRYTRKSCAVQVGK